MIHEQEVDLLRAAEQVLLEYEIEGRISPETVDLLDDAVEAAKK